MEESLDGEALSKNLSTFRIGRRIHAYDSADSTMDILHRLAAAGEPEGSVVVSEGQTKGRGRMGRIWFSPKGKGVYLSILFRPQMELSRVSAITLMSAVAVAQAVRECTGLKPEIKWPNDLMVSGRKLAGILTELNGQGGRVNYCIVGIGINVSTSGPDLPEGAASLEQELGRPVSRLELARALLRQMDRLYGEFLDEGLQPILESWRSFAGFLGKRVRVAAEGRFVEGQALDVDSNGALLVRMDSGIIEPVSAGEVSIIQ